MKRLEELAAAIQHNEGWKRGSRAWQNNNPGNLRNSPFAVGTTDGFATFQTYEAGWHALWVDLWIKCTGRSKTGLKPTDTLRNLARVWAPASDNNDPEAYANALALQLGVNLEVRLSHFTEDL